MTCRAVGGRLVLYHPETDEVSWLNEVGALVWGMLDGSQTLDELTTTVAAHFQTDTETVTDDLVPLLEELGRKRLLASPGPRRHQP